MDVHSLNSISPQPGNVSEYGRRSARNDLPSDGDFGFQALIPKIRGPFP